MSGGRLCYTWPIESTMRLVFSHFSTSASPRTRKFRNLTWSDGSSSSDDLISRSSGVGGQGSDFDSLNVLDYTTKEQGQVLILIFGPQFICVGHSICNGDAGTVDQVIGDATFVTWIDLGKSN